MYWDYDERRRRERNYRFMFRAALVCIAISFAVMVAGGMKAIVDSQSEWLAYGLLMFVWSGVSAYLTVDSTVKIIELDMQDAPQTR